MGISQPYFSIFCFIFIFFPSWLLRYIVGYYASHHKRMNLGKLVDVEFNISVIMTMIKIMTTSDVIVIELVDIARHLKMMATSQLLYVVLHSFLLFQAKSPKRGKSETHCTTLEAFHCSAGRFEEKASEAAGDARLRLLRQALIFVC